MLLLCSVTKNKKIMIDEKDVEVIPQEEMESLKGGDWVYIEEYDEYIWLPDVR